MYCQWLDGTIEYHRIHKCHLCSQCGVVEFISHDSLYMEMRGELLGRLNGSDKICAVIMSAIKMEFIILFRWRNVFR